MDLLRRENLADLTNLLLKWWKEDAGMRSNLAANFNIKDQEKLQKLSEFQTLKVSSPLTRYSLLSQVLHETIKASQNAWKSLYELNSNIVRMILELYAQPASATLILEDFPDVLDLFSKIMVVYPENEEELYNVFSSHEDLLTKSCPITLLHSKLSNSTHISYLTYANCNYLAGHLDEVSMKLLHSAIRFRCRNFRCLEVSRSFNYI